MLSPSVLRRLSTYRSTSVPRPKGVQGATKDGTRQGKGDTVEEEGHERRRGTREERRIRGANQRRNRPFHLYAARIQLTLHLLLSFFFSSRCLACLCVSSYTGCPFARVHCNPYSLYNLDTPLSCLNIPVTSLTKFVALYLYRFRRMRRIVL